MPPRTRKPDDEQQQQHVETDSSSLLSIPPRFVPKGVETTDVVPLPAPPELRELGFMRVMTPDEYAARLAHLRAPFPASQMEKLPRQLRRGDEDRGRCGDGYSADGFDCGGWHPRSIHLDYVGHAGVTMRLLEVDPLWSWEPVVRSELGTPVMSAEGAWITLTVLGMTRLGFGDAAGKRGPNADKELIGDAIRNAALRFGVATYLWSKSAESQVLRAGGEVDADEPAPTRTTRHAAPQSQQSQRRERGRATAAQPAQPAQQPQDAMDPITALAYRQQIIDVVDATTPGAQRDEQLRALRDTIGGEGGLQISVELPEPWQRDGQTHATLYQLIIGGRGERTKSSATAPEDFDPWATAAPDESEQS